MGWSAFFASFAVVTHVAGEPRKEIPLSIEAYDHADDPFELPPETYTVDLKNAAGLDLSGSPTFNFGTVSDGVRPVLVKGLSFQGKLEANGKDVQLIVTADGRNAPSGEKGTSEITIKVMPGAPARLAPKYGGTHDPAGGGGQES